MVGTAFTIGSPELVKAWGGKDFARTLDTVLRKHEDELHDALTCGGDDCNISEVEIMDDSKKNEVIVLVTFRSTLAEVSVSLNTATNQVAVMVIKDKKKIPGM